MKSLALLLLFFASSAFSSGPVAPDGWDGSFAGHLPSGASCCLPADLNGSGLVGGAFVLLSKDKSEFALFALTYTPDSKEHWQLLERHPASMLRSFRFSVVPDRRFPHGAIKSCTASGKCAYYFAPGSNAPLQRANNSFKPKPLRGSA